MPAIVFNSNGHLAIMDADGGNATVILPYAGDANDLEPSWSPDGTQIVFNGTIAGSGIYVINVDGSGLRLVTIYVINVDGSGLRLVTPLNAYYLGNPDWSRVPAPDGRYKILFNDVIAPPGAGARHPARHPVRARRTDRVAVSGCLPRVPSAGPLIPQLSRFPAGNPAPLTPRGGRFGSTRSLRYSLIFCRARGDNAR